MKLKEKLAYILMLSKMQDSYWLPDFDGSKQGTGYFKIDLHWYYFIKFLSGMRPEDLLKKGLYNAQENSQA